MATNIEETPAKNVVEQEQGTIAVSSDGAAVQNNLRNIRLIIGREYKNRVTQHSFIITSVVLLVIVFLAAFIPTIVQLIKAGPTSQTSQTHIVVVNDAGSVAGLTDTELAATIGTTLNGTAGTQTAGIPVFALTFSTVNELANLQQQVKSGQLDILLVLDRASNQDMRFTYDTDASATNDSNQSTMQSLAQLLTFLDSAHRLGLTSQETQHLGAPPDFTAVHAQQSQNTRTVSEIVTGYVLAYAGAILLYTCIGLYAGIVAAGVAEEKSSRMMELLLNAATPFQLLAGKIVGIGAACLTQMGCMVVVGIVGLLLQTPLQAALFGAKAGGFSQYLTGVSIPFYLLFLLYVLLAFFLYATLFAGLASLVKRQEEVQSAIILPVMLVLSGYLLFFFAVNTPDATVTKVLSYIPFWTPWLMLPRIALGTVAWWEIVVTIVLMLGAFLASTWFAARLYRYGVLMYGQRPGLGQLLKLVRMN